jgi:hypothetical protein
MGKHTPMDKQAAARIQSAAARHPDSATAREGWDRQAQSLADRREHDQHDDAEDPDD